MTLSNRSQRGAVMRAQHGVTVHARILDCAEHDVCRGPPISHQPLPAVGHVAAEAGLAAFPRAFVFCAHSFLQMQTHFSDHPVGWRFTSCNWRDGPIRPVKRARCGLSRAVRCDATRGGGRWSLALGPPAQPRLPAPRDAST
jgi:hypothetical protein